MDLLRMNIYINVYLEMFLFLLTSVEQQ